MLTPSNERTEKKLKAAPVQTVQNGTLFQEPRITEWRKRESKVFAARIGKWPLP
jgi:hypothetical protein